MKVGQKFQIYTEKMDFEGYFIGEIAGSLLFNCGDFDLRVTKSKIKQTDLIDRKIWVVS